MKTLGGLFIRISGASALFGLGVALAPAPIHADDSAFMTFLGDIATNCQLADISGPTVFNGNPPQSWGYQLQNDNADIIAAAPVDVIVTDYSKDGTAPNAFRPDEVARMKINPATGKPRLVIAYVSIGEAEVGRWYFKNSWLRSKPSWLGAQDEDWAGDYAVQYWQQAWQDIIIDDDSSYIKQVIAAGFDGVYLDKIDEYVYKATLNHEAPDEYGNVSIHGRYADRMVAFVKKISDQSKAINPNFVVIAQNAEDLLDRDDYRAVIDGVGKESLLFHTTGTVLTDGSYSSGYATGVPNTKDDVCSSALLLRELQADGKPVLVVEYLTDADKVDAAGTALGSVQIVPTFQPQDLARLVLPGQTPTKGE